MRSGVKNKLIRVPKNNLLDKSVDGPTIVWFRQDLRIEDNPALLAAVSRQAPVIPLYIWSPEHEQDWFLGRASRVWLHQSLVNLGIELGKYQSRLIIRQGDVLNVLKSLVNETGASALFWNRRYEPTLQITDEAIENKISENFARLTTGTFNGSLLFEPWQIKQKNNRPYQVFTAFWRACEFYGEPSKPVGKPRSLVLPAKWPDSVPLGELNLQPNLDWADGIKAYWPASSMAAKKRLRHFIEKEIGQYSVGRNRPDLELVSQLSPYLHFGQLSPREVFQTVKTAMGESNDKEFVANCQIYLKEIGWREFAYHLLFHFPHTTDKPLRSQYAKFPWVLNEAFLTAWQTGHTGYPIIDAGMRQLWQIGWMHNRVRMIVASFLVKDLLIPWQLGARWFWDTLIDADLASNTLNWQWTAGCGADAAPYFRIFNPISQGQKFDPNGDYVRKFVPELIELPTKYIHSPWLASKNILQTANVELGKNYPKPIVNHTEVRLKALAAWRQMGED